MNSTRPSLTTVTRELRAKLAAGEDPSGQVFPTHREHDGLELDVTVSVRGKKLTLADAAKNWQWTGPTATSPRSRSKMDLRDVHSTSIRCPCCRQAIVRGDVWYDCRCFQGGHKSGCENCTLETPDRDAHIAATIREWGWDKDPSPGMLDYLTPGWR